MQRVKLGGCDEPLTNLRDMSDEQASKMKVDHVILFIVVFVFEMNTSSKSKTSNFKFNLKLFSFSKCDGTSSSLEKAKTEA
jgi:hypothetical protein